MAALDNNNSTRVMDDDQEIDLADLANVLIQGWMVIAAVFVVVLGLGASYAVLTPPVYEADALIQVEDQRGGAGLAGLTVLSEGLGLQQSVVADELEILRSREVLLKAIESTKADLTVGVANRFPVIGDWWARRHEAGSDELATPLFGFGRYAWGGEVLELGEFQIPSQAFGREFFLVVSEQGFSLENEEGQELLQDNRIGQRLSFTVGGDTAYLAVTRLQARPGTKFLIRKRSPIATYNSVRNSLNVTQAGKQSQVITIKYQSTDKAFAKDFVNAVASTYLEQNVQRRSAEARQSLAFLDEQLPLLKHQVEQKEEELSQYRSSSGTISIPDETRGLLTQAIDLENRRLELQMKRDEMRQRYTADHPMLKAVNQQLAALQAASKDLSTHIDNLPEAQRDLLRLERDSQVNTQLYISLLNNAQQLRLAEAGTIGNVRIIDFAVLPERPVKPKRLMVVAVAALLGLLLGAGAVLVRRMLRPAVQTAEQIEQRTGLTTYVSLPESEDQKGFRIAMPGRKRRPQGAGQVLALTNPDDPAIESLRSLRTGLTFAMMGTEGKTIAIVGATAGVGKSFVTTNLGALLSIEQKKVVIVDTDLRRGRLHEYFGYERKRIGLSDVLSGKSSIDEALIKINDYLYVVPSGTPPPNPAELLLSEGFVQLLQQFEAQYDQVVIDTAPLLPVADTLAIMPHVDAAFMVVRAEQSTVREVQDAVARLRTAGVAEPLKGVVFNGVRRFRLGYGASYNYYYTYK